AWSSAWNERTFSYSSDEGGKLLALSCSPIPGEVLVRGLGSGWRLSLRTSGIGLASGRGGGSLSECVNTLRSTGAPAAASSACKLARNRAMGRLKWNVNSSCTLLSSGVTVATSTDPALSRKGKASSFSQIPGGRSRTSRGSGRQDLSAFSPSATKQRATV